MTTLNPTINTNIGFEQPVATPSVIGGVAQLASGFLSAQPKPRQPSESDKQSVALRPFAERLDALRESDLTDQEFLQHARKLTRNAIINYPQYESEITGISETHGVTAPSDIFSPQDTIVDNVSNWATNTTEGQLAILESQVVDASGQVNMELTLQNLTVAYQEDLASKAQIEQSNRDMQLVENDLKTWKAQSDTKIGSVFLPKWTNKTTKQVNSLVSMALSGDPTVDTVEEQLTFLRRNRTTLYNTFVGEAQAAGLHQSVYSGAGETNIIAALKPIDNLIAQVEGQAKDIGTVLDSYRNAQEANALEQAVEVYGSVGVLPEFQRLVFSVAANVFSEETATFLKGLKDMEAVGGLRMFEDPSPIVDQNAEDRIRLGVADGQLSVEDIVTTAGKAISKAEMSDHSSAAKLLQQQYRMLDATNALLAPSALANIYNPQAINNVSQAIAVGDEFSEEVRTRYLDFSAKQVRMNIEVLSNNLAASNGLDTETVGGVLYLTQNGVRKTTAMPGEVKAKAALKAIDNINTINRASRKILGLPSETIEDFSIPNPDNNPNVTEIESFLKGVPENNPLGQVVEGLMSTQMSRTMSPSERGSGFNPEQSMANLLDQSLVNIDQPLSDVAVKNILDFFGINPASQFGNQIVNSLTRVGEGQSTERKADTLVFLLNQLQLRDEQSGSLQGGTGVAETGGGEGTDRLTGTQFAGDQAPEGTFTVPDEVRNDTDFLQAVSNSSGRLGFDPSDLLRVIQFETAGTFDPSIKAETSSATGLIQFLESTAKELGTSTAQLKNMTRAQQMFFVEKYLSNKLQGVENPNFGDLYMAVHYPVAVGKDDSYVLYKKGSKAYTANSGLDTNKDGTVTRGEAVSRAFGKTGGVVVPTPSRTGEVEVSLRPQLRPDIDLSLPEPEAIQVSDTVTSQQLGIIENGIREDGGATPSEEAQASPEAAQQAAQTQWDALQTQTKMMLMRVLGGTEEDVVRMIQNGELDVGDLADE